MYCAKICAESPKYYWRRDCLSSELAHWFPSNVSVQLTNVTSGHLIIILAQKHRFTVEPAFNDNSRFAEVEGRRICYPAKLPLDFKGSGWSVGCLLRTWYRKQSEKNLLVLDAFPRTVSNNSFVFDAFSVRDEIPQGALAGRLERSQPSATGCKNVHLDRTSDQKQTHVASPNLSPVGIRRPCSRDLQA